MNPAPAFAICLVACHATFAAEQSIMPDEVVGSVQVWLEENVDDWVFDLTNVEQETLHRTLAEVQEEIQQVMSTDKEPKREDAEQLLLVLHEFDSTRSYVPQLHSLLDLFIGQTPSTNSVAPITQPTTRPSLPEARLAWLSVLSKRPVPTTAKNYLEQLGPIFEAEKIPPDLVWMAEVESAFNPDARSPVGAVGLFQLMPETARSLGLSTWFPDERRIATQNAGAAAKYLRYLHNRFGNWQLALAAYNAGPTRIARLLRESDAFSYEAIAYQVPRETFDYVAKVEATLMVRRGVELSGFDQPTVTASE